VFQSFSLIPISIRGLFLFKIAALGGYVMAFQFEHSQFQVTAGIFRPIRQNQCRKIPLLLALSIAASARLALDFIKSVRIVCIWSQNRQY